MEKTIAREVTLATFEREVIERSRSVPVVVDFWAPWCQPCLMLGPVLERLAEQADGAWELAKINTDYEQELSLRFGIQGIPAVKAFRDGKLVSEFVGVLPERSIRAFLARIIPTRADQLTADARERVSKGDLSGAEALLREALGQDKDHAGATMAMAEILLERGQEDAARPLLESLPPHTDEGRRAVALLKRLQFISDSSGLPSREEALAALAANPDDFAAVWTLAVRAAGTGDYAEALSRFLDLLERNRQYKDDGARKAMLAIFTILGPDHELSMAYRPLLAAALH
ncbi:MAG TPA: tetratricopeptide repeat protein [Chloroflexota bacterium]|nr:tetratricopeptide repeat protein [Chloroflexota bacterium]